MGLGLHKMLRKIPIEGLKGLDRELESWLVVDSKGVVADALVLATHKKHGLRHRLVQLHRVVPRTAGQVENR